MIQTTTVKMNVVYTVPCTCSTVTNYNACAVWYIVQNGCMVGLRSKFECIDVVLCM